MVSLGESLAGAVTVLVGGSVQCLPRLHHILLPVTGIPPPTAAFVSAPAAMPASPLALAPTPQTACCIVGPPLAHQQCGDNLLLRLISVAAAVPAHLLSRAGALAQRRSSSGAMTEGHAGAVSAAPQAQCSQLRLVGFDALAALRFVGALLHPSQAGSRLEWSAIADAASSGTLHVLQCGAQRSCTPFCSTWPRCCQSSAVPLLHASQRAAFRRPSCICLVQI